MEKKKNCMVIWEKVCFGFAILIVSMVFLHSPKVQAVEVTEGDFVFDVNYYDSTAILTRYKGTELNVVVPSTVDNCIVTEIRSGFGYGVFKNVHKYLTSVTLPETIKVIGKAAFRDCQEIKQIKIPSSVSTIESDAFHSCSSLEEVIIPSSVELLGAGVFRGCTKLKKVNLPSSIHILQNYLFYQCSNLMEVNIPSSITQIGEQAFGQCTSLKTIIIPSSVTTIGVDAFGSCKSLTEIVIPVSVLKIESAAFAECSGLTKVFILGNPNISGIVFPSSAELVIYGIKGSNVEEYCKNRGTHFVGFEAPVLSLAKQTKKGITLSFSEVSGINSYDIYRMDVSTGIYQKIATVKENSYEDTKVKSGTSYYYKVAVSYDFDGTVLNDIMSDSINIYYEYVSKPAKAPVIKLKKDKDKMNVKIKKQNVQYFELQYSTSRKFPTSSTKILSYSSDNRTIVIDRSNFLSKKKYYIRVRAYNMDSKSKSYYGKWSQVKNFTFNK